MQFPILTRAEFAKLCDVAPATVTNWMNDGMPCVRSGRSGREVEIDPAKALPWVIAHREAPPGSQRERLAKAQAEKVEMENEQRRGRTIDAGQVEETMLGLAAYLAREHDALPGRVANELAGINEPAVIRSRLLEECRAIREGLAQFSSRTADALSDLAEECDDLPAAAESDGEPMGGPVENSPPRKRRARKVAK
jgi:phage terminase Nu1 subunit (DNA packaging protein)